METIPLTMRHCCNNKFSRDPNDIKYLRLISANPFYAYPRLLFNTIGQSGILYGASRDMIWWLTTQMSQQTWRENETLYTTIDYCSVAGLLVVNLMLYWLRYNKILLPLYRLQEAIEQEPSVTHYRQRFQAIKKLGVFSSIQLFPRRALMLLINLVAIWMSLSKNPVLNLDDGQKISEYIICNVCFLFLSYNDSLNMQTNVTTEALHHALKVSPCQYLPPCLQREKGDEPFFISQNKWRTLSYFALLSVAESSIIYLILQDLLWFIHSVLSYSTDANIILPITIAYSVLQLSCYGTRLHCKTFPLMKILRPANTQRTDTNTPLIEKNTYTAIKHNGCNTFAKVLQKTFRILAAIISAVIGMWLTTTENPTMNPNNTVFLSDNHLTFSIITALILGILAYWDLVSTQNWLLCDAIEDKPAAEQKSMGV